MSLVQFHSYCARARIARCSFFKEKLREYPLPLAIPTVELLERLRMRVSGSRAGRQHTPSRGSIVLPFRRKQTVATILSALVVTAAGVFFLLHHGSNLTSITVQGVVLRQDNDVRRQLPVDHAMVTLSAGNTRAVAYSDPSGHFKAQLRTVVWPGRLLALNFQHPDYQPSDMEISVGFRSSRYRLYVVRMNQIPAPTAATDNPASSLVSNLRVRYVVNAKSEDNIGSVVRTFEAVNQGNVPCNRQSPCSPDGRWKAANGYVSLDAGKGNEFRNIRVSCIAGPCPFTKIDPSAYVNGGRNISAAVLDWSDTATFLIEAEVYHASVNSNVHHLFPVFFGRTLNFTLPLTQEGVSIEAEVNGTPMVFPLGPDLYLSWATCTMRETVDAEQSTVYRCELKPGYHF